jgi:MYXO-CTERM domain-containing protein
MNAVKRTAVAGLFFAAASGAALAQTTATATDPAYQPTTVEHEDDGPDLGWLGLLGLAGLLGLRRKTDDHHDATTTTRTTPR